MADQTIGTARIEIEIDNSKVEPGINRAKQSVSSLTTEVEQGSQRQVQATTRQIKALERQIATLGKDREEIIRWRIAQQTTGAEAARLTALLDKQAASMAKAATSSGQYRAALRSLPAQGTDIVTQLAGGQNLGLVLLQQGGQIRDQFGSASLAIRGVGTALAGLVNPITLSAAAVGVLGYAWYDAAKQQEAYTAALALSRNEAGLTESALADLALQAAKAENARVGLGADAAVAIAKNGQIARDSAQDVANAAVAMSQLTDQAVDDTVAAFAKLGQDPTKYALELNEQIGFLTSGLYEQIRALQDQGKTQEAAAIATKAASQATQEALARVRESQVGVAKWWDELGVKASNAWDRMKQGLGFQNQAQELQDLLKQNSEAVDGLRFLQSEGKRASVIQKAADDIKERTARIRQLLEEAERQNGEAQVQAAQQTAVRTSAALDAIIESQATKEEKKRTEIAKVTGDAEVAIERAKAAGLIKEAERLEAKRQDAIAAITKKYADKNAGKAAAAQVKSDSNSAQTLVESIQRQITANEQLRDTSEKVTAGDRLAIQAKQMLEDQNNKMSASARALLKAILPELEASEKLTDSYTKQEKAKEALARQNAIFELQNQNQARGNEADLVQIGHGGEAAELLRRQLDIRRAYEDEVKRLGDKGVADDKDSWDALAANAKRHYDEMLEAERKFQSERMAALGDWRNGAQAAMQDYAFGAADVASQTKDAFTNAFEGAEDALVDFTKTGKLSFRDLADSIISDLTRIAAKQGISTLVGYIAGAFGSTASAPSTSGGQGFGNNTSWLTGSLTPNARGGVYDSPSLSRYSNSIVHKPTMFAFAKGAGLMGEAGPEAILPLRRSSDGRLGVQASASGAGAQIAKVEVNIENNSGGQMTAEPSGVRFDGEKLIVGVLVGAIASGKADSALGARYGMRAKGVALG